MALVLADRVVEQTTTNGTGTLTLTGAVSKYQSFAVIGNGNTTYYTIVHQTLNQWEVGIGTYTAVGTTLSRDTVLASSNANALVNFGGGSKYVFADYPAGKAVYQDASGNVTVAGTATFGSFIPTSSTLPTNGMYLPAANTLAWSINSVEGMRLTATALGLNVVPSAWGTSFPAFQLSTGAVHQTSGAVSLGQNYYINSSSQRIYSTTNFTSEYVQASGEHRWFYSPSGTAGTAVTPVELGRFTSSGLLINTTTPVTNSKLVIGSADITVNGVTIGRGTSNVFTNTAVGGSVLSAVTTGNSNSGVGYFALRSITTGANNSAIGESALFTSTTGNFNTAIGRAALYASTGSNNTGVGYQALSQLSTGANNTTVGASSGTSITTGSFNTILGRFSGNQNGLDIRTSDLYIVLSDGVGQPRWIVDGNGIAGYGPSTGGTVTQTGSRTTGVTIAKSTGSITLVSAAGTTAWQSFTVTNGFVSAADTIHVVQQSGTDLYQIFVTNVSAGSFRITFATTGGTTTEQPVFNFTVIKGQTI